MTDTQRILKGEKITIMCDYREKEICNILKNLDAIVNSTSLDVADFVCSERVGIERKSFDDFVNSIIDGRIFEQAKDLKENFERPIILIEGFSDRNISDNALKGAIASLMIDHGISLVSTKNPLDTAKTIYWIAKKEQRESKKGLAIKVGKKPKEQKRMQEFIISSIPGVSNILAKRLLEHFGTVENIFSANEEELKRVDGIGEKLAKRIKNIMRAKYN